MRPLALAALLLLAACAHGPSGAPPEGPPRASQGRADGAATSDVTGGGWSATPEALLRLAESRPAPAGADTEIVEETVSYRFLGDGTVERSFHRVLRILTRQGVEDYGQFVIPWRERDGRPRVRVRVVTPDGRVHALEEADLLDRSADDGRDRVLDDQRRLEGTLPALTPGAVIEERVTRRHPSRFEAGYVWREPLQRTAPVRRLVVRVAWHPERPVRWEVRGEARQRPVARTGEWTRVEWVVLDGTPWRRAADLMPWEQDAWPEVRFTTGRSWTEVARAYALSVEEALSGLDLSAEAAAATGGATELETQVDRLLAWMEGRVRYTSLALGDGAWRPASPRSVITRGWGDCKDQSTLLVGLLRALGHEAHVVLVRTDPDPVSPELPGLGTFDHAIVRVAGAAPLWIDPTTPRLAPGRLPRADEGRPALVANAATRGLTRTPDPEPGAHLYRETHVYRMDGDGGVSVEERTEAWGDAALRLGGSFRGTDEVGFQTWAEGFFERAYGGPLAQAENGDGEDGRYRIVLRGEASRGAWVGLDRVGVWERFDGVLSALPGVDAEPVEGRVRPVELPSPTRLELRVRLQVPPGFEVGATFEPLEMRVGPVLATRRLEAAEPGWAEVRMVLDPGDGRLTAGQYRELHERLLPKLRAQFQVPLVHTARAALEAGRAVEAVALARAEASARPEDATAHRRLAALLLEVGLQEPARVEARRAVELAPDSAEAWHGLGKVLQHDAAGRLRGRGYDRPAALDALRRALGLDPESDAIRAELALALEYGAGDARNLDPEDLAAAVEIWEGGDGLVDRARYRPNYLVDLLVVGRLDRLLTVTQAGTSDIDLEMALAARTALEDAEAAARAARSRIRDPEARTERMRRAAYQLLLARRYREASGLFAILGKETRNFEVQSLARQLERARPLAEIADTSTPSGPVLRLFDWMARPDEAFPAEILSERGLLAPEALEAQAGTMLQALAGRAEGFPPSVALDVGFSVFSPVVDGDDATGYRVRLPREDIPWFALVVREDGAYRLLADLGSQLALGDAVRRQVAEGRPEVARRWLRWSLEAGTLRNRPTAVCGATGLLETLRALSDGEAEDLRLAAAILMLFSGEPAPEALAIARAARPGDDSADTWRRVAVTLGSVVLDRPEEVLEDAEAMSRACPGSAALTNAWFAAALQAGRTDILEREGRRLLASPDPDQRDLGLGVLMEASRVEAVLDELEARVRASRRSPSLLNNLAWYRLLAGGSSAQAVEEAEQAVALQAGRGGSASALHTLAAAHAAADHAMEARAALVRSLDQAEDGEVGPAAWLVLGRIAATYQLDGYARQALGRAVDGCCRMGSGAEIGDLAKRWMEALED